MNFRSLDALNRVTGLTTNGASANLAYAANLKLKNISYGNNVQQAYTYDSRGRPARITISRLSNTLLDLRYSYDNVGNILSIYNSTSTESYTFDALNRLKSTTGTWGTLKYGYNATGDRLWMWSSNGSTNTTYSYGATSTSFNRLYSAGSTSYSYDNNGNIKTETTGSVTKYYSYDFENRLTKVTQGSSTLGSYGYSPNGVRVLSIESGSSTVSVSTGVNVIYEKTIGQSTSNDYMFADGLLIVKLSGGTVYYYHQDHLGNTRLVTVGSQIQYSSSYQPYGPAYHPSGTDPVYKYTRKPQSPATGLYYYGARWYNTTLGRFPNTGSEEWTINITTKSQPVHLCSQQSTKIHRPHRNRELRFVERRLSRKECGQQWG